MVVAYIVVYLLKLNVGSDRRRAIRRRTVVVFIKWFHVDLSLAE